MSIYEGAIGICILVLGNVSGATLEAQLPIHIYIYIYWVPVLKSLYNSILSVTQGPTIWVPGLLG